MIGLRSSPTWLVTTLLVSSVIVLGCDNGDASPGGGGGSGGVAGSGGSGGDGASVELVIVAHGRTARLLDVTGGTIQELSSAEIPSPGLLDGHQILSASVEPGRQRIFVGSANDCSARNDVGWCHGNGRIDRFTYTQTSITYDGLAYEMNDAAFQADGIACAEGTEADTGYLGQEGTCAPVGLAMSPDGSRLYTLERGSNDVGLFAVDPSSGELSFLAEGGPAGSSGVGAHPDGTHVYHGSHVFDVSSDMVVRIHEGQSGNAAEVIEGVPDLLVTTLDVSALGVFDLTDRTAPVEIDSLSLGSGEVRDQAHNQALTRFVVVGQDSVRTLSFDGASLAAEHGQVTVNPQPQQNRAVALTGENDELAVVAFFRAGSGDPIANGGVTLYGIDGPTGRLTLLDEADFDGPGRVALSVIAR